MFQLLTQPLREEPTTENADGDREAREGARQWPRGKKMVAAPSVVGAAAVMSGRGRKQLGGKGDKASTGLAEGDERKCGVPDE